VKDAVAGATYVTVGGLLFLVLEVGRGPRGCKVAKALVLEPGEKLASFVKPGSVLDLQEDTKFWNASTLVFAFLEEQGKVPT